MDIQPTSQQPISDDQELAKVLAGVNQQAEEAASAPIASDTPTDSAAPMADPMAVTTPAPEEVEPVATPAPEPVVAPMPSMPSTGSSDLESIKKDALSELRPLVDKLNVDTVKALADPDVKKRFADLGVEAVSSTPAEFAAFIKDEMAKYAKLIKEANIKVNQ